MRAITSGPDLDVVRLEHETHAPVQPERLDERARELEPADAVEHGVLLGDDVMVATIGGGPPAQGLGAGAAVADRDRPADLLGHERVMGDQIGPAASSVAASRAISAAVATIGQSARVRRRLTSHAPRNERISCHLPGSDVAIAEHYRLPDAPVRARLGAQELRVGGPKCCTTGRVIRTRADVVASARARLTRPDRWGSYAPTSA